MSAKSKRNKLAPIEAQEYDRLLKEFVRVCTDLVQGGMPYLAVILCHELFRFLYPADPPSGYVAKRPLEFITELIGCLTTEGKHFAQVVSPYAFRIESSKAEDVQVEKSTSNLYAAFWNVMDEAAITQESVELLGRRLPEDVIAKHVDGRTVLDMGCGSGRYAIALAHAGARQVVALDWSSRAYQPAKEWCERGGLRVQFVEGNVLELPFEAHAFNFVFSNGVIHHTRSIEGGLREIWRVLKPDGHAFLYIYGAGGVFWTTRAALRDVFKRIPLAYTQRVLDMIGMPSNRFIFCDTWYVPIETHTTRAELLGMLDRLNFTYRKLVGRNAFDLDGALDTGVEGADAMWGDGEHRYILGKARVI